MKREEVLFYMTNDKIHVYLSNAKREIIEEVNTSTFFKYGEISDIEICREEISSFISRNNLIKGVLKPDLIVLYNDICNCDLEYLYKSVLAYFNYNEIKFLRLTNLVKNIKNYENIVIYDKDYYTIIGTKEKKKNLSDLDFLPIVIGEIDKDFLHFSDKNLIWNIFKTHFTNL